MSKKYIYNIRASQKKQLIKATKKHKSKMIIMMNDYQIRSEPDYNILVTCFSH